MISLNKAVIGKSYFFIGSAMETSVEKHLMDLGLRKGKELRVLSKQGNESMIVQLQDNRIALTSELCATIIIEEQTHSSQVDYLKLGNLSIGQTYTVAGFLGKGQVRRRLMDMGITKGVEVMIRKRAPLGDPLEINLRGYELTLRKAEADMILVYGNEA